MKKFFIAIFFISYFNNSQPYILGVYDPNGYNFLTQIFDIKNKAEMLLAAPKDLLRAFLDYYLPGTRLEDAGPELILDLIYKNNIEFFTYIWGPVLDSSKKPKNRQYNITFHHDVHNWFKERYPLGNFNINVPMGIFNADGIRQIESSASEEAKPIAFNKISPRSVNMHDDGTALSPNNAQFELIENRNVATFWAIALSPEKNNGKIVFNIFVDSNDLHQEFHNLIMSLEKSRSLNDLLKGMQEIAQKTAKENTADANALTNAAITLGELIKPIEKINILFNDNNFNNTFMLFPITFPVSFINFLDEKAYQIYQFKVLSQYLQGQACLKDVVIGNTCGRHSFKNAVFCMLALREYKNKNKKLFEMAANSLTELTPEAQCVFLRINEEVKKNRLHTKVNPNEATISPDEAKEIINKINDITRSCNIRTLNSNEFTVISDVTTLMPYLTTGATEFDEDFIDQINLFRSAPIYQHAFIIGAGKIPGEHWIVIIADKTAQATNFIVMDSADNADRINSPYTKELIKILTDTTYANTDQIRISILSNKLIPAAKNGFKTLEEIFNQLGSNKINGKEINTLANIEKQLFIKKLFSQIAELIRDYNNANVILNKIGTHEKAKLGPELSGIENFIIQDFTKFMQSFSLFKDLKGFNKITDKFSIIIQEFLKNHDAKDFETKIGNLLNELNISNYLQEFPNLINNINERGNNQFTALHVAATNGDLEGAKDLIKLGADVNATGVLNITPLMQAAYYDHANVAKLLLENKADTNLKTSNTNQTALDIAKSRGSLKTAELLEKPIKLEKYLKEFPNLMTNPNEKGNHQFTALHVAATDGDLESAKEIIKLGANVNALGVNNITPLMQAAYYDHADIVKLLIENGADTSIKTSNTNQTAMDIARARNSQKSIELLEKNK